MKKETWDIILSVSTVVLALFTAWMAFSTFWLAKESREASFRQIGVQLWIEFQKRFDSLEVVKARKKLATQMRAKTPPKRDRISETVLNFFEDVGVSYDGGFLNKGLADDSFSYFLCRWWEALKPYVHDERRRHKEDATLFANFERLAGQMRLPNEVIDDVELARFLEDESRLVDD
ncbi:MAG TPA: DUF4760 domain-containing protein [Chthoniobacter sp.]|jgi:hypothetical protein